MIKPRSSQDRIDISIIVNAHNENTLLHRTLKSIQQNIRLAQKANLSCEVVVVADKVDNLTKDYLENRISTSLSSDISLAIEYVDYGDLGLSRNHGVDKSTGNFIANFDGDDIWCERWLVNSYNFLKDKKNAIAHPSVVVSFGAKHNIWHVRSSTDASFDPRSCIEDNWWTSTMMTHRSTFDKVRYRKTLRDRSFSFEDWLWNMETLAAGIEHVVVPDTVWFYRRKPTSMLTQQLGGIVSDNNLMTPAGVEKYIQKRVKNVASLSISKRTPVVESKNNDERIETESIIPNRGRIKEGLIKSARKSGKIVFKVGKKYIKPQIEKHHRLSRFSHTMIEASRELLYTPSSDDGTREVGARSGPEVYKGVYVPEWVINDWRKLNDIDPEIFPTRKRLNSLHARRLMTMGREQRAYWGLAEKIGGGVDYLVATPWLKTSGASLVALRYANAYIENNPNAKVVVLATEDVECPWEERLNEQIKFVKVDRDFTVLSKDDQSKVIAKLIVQLKPKRLHVVHSQEVFRAASFYAPQMTLNTKLYFSAFAYDYSPEGMRQSAFLMNGEPALPYVTRIFCDNQWIVDDTIDTFGVSRSIFKVHKMPIDKQNREVEDHDSESGELGGSNVFRILWASRVAKAKRPDILYDIIKRAKKDNLPVEFVVYGELYGNSVSPKILENISKMPNVKYMGGFSRGVIDIPNAKDYDAFLLTSEGEGMPNTIIEAQALGLPVIASNVGGVSETVVSGKTGYTIKPFDDINSYIESIKKLLSNRDLAKKYGANAKNIVEKERSWKFFLDQIKNDF